MPCSLSLSSSRRNPTSAWPTNWLSWPLPSLPPSSPAEAQAIRTPRLPFGASQSCPSLPAYCPCSPCSVSGSQPDPAVTGSWCLLQEWLHYNHSCLSQLKSAESLIPLFCSQAWWLHCMAVLHHEHPDVWHFTHNCLSHELHDTRFCLLPCFSASLTASCLETTIAPLQPVCRSGEWQPKDMQEPKSGLGECREDGSREGELLWGVPDLPWAYMRNWRSVCSVLISSTGSAGSCSWAWELSGQSISWRCCINTHICRVCL